MNEIIIRQTGCIMVLYPNELYQLPKEILIKGLQRGKGLKRVQANDKRMAQGFDRWQLYEYLKGTRDVDSNTISHVETMCIEELREAVLEFLLMRQRVS